MGFIAYIVVLSKSIDFQMFPESSSNPYLYFLRLHILKVNFEILP